MCTHNVVIILLLMSISVSHSSTIITTAEFFYTSIQNGTREAEFILEFQQIDYEAQQGWIVTQLRDGFRWTAASMISNLPGAMYTDGPTETQLAPNQLTQVFIKLDGNVAAKFKYSVFLSLEVPRLNHEPTHTTVILDRSSQELTSFNGFSIAPTSVDLVKGLSVF
eukprot:Filipodium_phascolosomae@DN7843_c0_g1_i1.p1